MLWYLTSLNLTCTRMKNTPQSRNDSAHQRTLQEPSTSQVWNEVGTLASPPPMSKHKTVVYFLFPHQWCSIDSERPSGKNCITQVPAWYSILQSWYTTVYYSLDTVYYGKYTTVLCFGIGGGDARVPAPFHTWDVEGFWSVLWCAESLRDWGVFFILVQVRLRDVKKIP